jgi:hypothetical protein
MDPTNNVAEQAIRFVVINRLVTQGTRSPKGRQWCQRIWTVLATCARQGRCAFAFLLDAVQAHFAGTLPPSLLASGGLPAEPLPSPYHPAAHVAPDQPSKLGLTAHP